MLTALRRPPRDFKKRHVDDGMGSSCDLRPPTTAEHGRGKTDLAKDDGKRSAAVTGVEAPNLTVCHRDHAWERDATSSVLDSVEKTSHCGAESSSNHDDCSAVHESVAHVHVLMDDLKGSVKGPTQVLQMMVQLLVAAARCGRTCSCSASVD